MYDEWINESFDEEEYYYLWAQMEAEWMEWEYYHSVPTQHELTEKISNDDPHAPIDTNFGSGKFFYSPFFRPRFCFS
jgi:outer membrane protein assembly factor BamE (lipoprotein component of BamABCDE complex)